RRGPRVRRAPAGSGRARRGRGGSGRVPRVRQLRGEGAGVPPVLRLAGGRASGRAVGASQLTMDHCESCGFTYELDRAEGAGERILAGVMELNEVVRMLDDPAVRPAPATWSPLEYL